MARILTEEPPVCPYCGEYVHREGPDAIDVCRDHGVVEGQTMSREEYERQEAEEER
jgi:hypothetical protein